MTTLAASSAMRVPGWMVSAQKREVGQPPGSDDGSDDDSSSSLYSSSWARMALSFCGAIAAERRARVVT
jgi:hypothetical protein